MKKDKKVAVFKVAGTPTVRGRHKHSASSWNRHKSYVGGESQAVIKGLLQRAAHFGFFHHSEKRQCWCQGVDHDGLEAINAEAREYKKKKKKKKKVAVFKVAEAPTVRKFCNISES